MIQYLMRRGGQSLVLLVMVSAIGFAILYMSPGGPLSQLAQSASMSQDDIDRLSRSMGLDRPFIVQYADWLLRMVRGDWGSSYRDGVGVLATIGSHIGATFMLMLVSTVLAALIGCTLGIWGAIRRHSLMDALTSIAAMVALSVPTFWFGLIAIYLFSIKLEWLPAGNQQTFGNGSFLDVVHHMIAPVLVLTLVETAVWARFMRASMIDTLEQDYIRTAKAKGVTGYAIIVSHALRNALLPMITLLGLQIPTLLGGALITETVFSWPGMGRLFFDSLEYRDYPVVMGVLMLSAVMVMLGSLIADVLYAIADPRIRMD